jgi:hypothetical protein
MAAGTLRWFAVMVALIGVLAAGAAWIGLRDWQHQGLDVTELSQARQDGRQLLALMGPRGACTDDCDARVLGRVAGSRWRLRLHAERWVACFDVDLSGFVVTPDRGVLGVRRVRCHAPARI